MWFSIKVIELWNFYEIRLGILWRNLHTNCVFLWSFFFLLTFKLFGFEIWKLLKFSIFSLMIFFDVMWILRHHIKLAEHRLVVRKIISALFIIRCNNLVFELIYMTVRVRQSTQTLTIDISILCLGLFFLIHHSLLCSISLWFLKW